MKLAEFLMIAAFAFLAVIGSNSFVGMAWAGGGSYSCKVSCPNGTVSEKTCANAGECCKADCCAASLASTLCCSSGVCHIQVNCSTASITLSCG